MILNLLLVQVSNIEKNDNQDQYYEIQKDIPQGTVTDNIVILAEISVEIVSANTSTTLAHTSVLALSRTIWHNSIKNFNVTAQILGPLGSEPLDLDQASIASVVFGELYNLVFEIDSVSSALENSIGVSGVVSGIQNGEI